ncbi:MAG: hypothetical protein LBJ64_10845 [Deltaproteobacteria bacterium]|jgi:hypothetical protein|nr:hypothetical protein [Deltaproteobacteria bacterium]
MAPRRTDFEPKELLDVKLLEDVLEEVPEEVLAEELLTEDLLFCPGRRPEKAGESFDSF